MKTKNKKLHVTHNSSIRSDVGLTLETSAFVISVRWLDFSKAFDSVSHRKLLFKLGCFGISGTLLDWFGDYLHDRK